jgi:hypothetical protein
MPEGLLILMLSVIGAGWIFEWLRRWKFFRHALQGAIAAGLVLSCAWFRHHIYTVVPFSYQDYGFYGLQMGAPQVFHWIQANADRYDAVFVAHDLFNAGDLFIPFYLRGETARKTKMFDMSQICRDPGLDIPEHSVFIAYATFKSGVDTSACPIQISPVSSIPDLKGRSLIDIIAIRRGVPDEGR